MGTSSVHGHSLFEGLLHCLRNKEVDCISVGSNLSGLYSFVETIKTIILQKAAKVGLISESIGCLNDNLQKKILNAGVSLSILEGYIIDTLLGKGCCLSFDNDGNLTNSLYGTTIISLDMRDIIHSSFPGLPLSIDEYFLFPVQNNEQKALNLLRDNKFHAVKFVKKGPVLDRAESEERLPVNRRVIDIMKEVAFQNIEIKQESGKPVYMNRIVKTKL